MKIIIQSVKNFFKSKKEV